MTFDMSPKKNLLLSPNKRMVIEINEQKLQRPSLPRNNSRPLFSLANVEIEGSCHQCILWTAKRTRTHRSFHIRTAKKEIERPTPVESGSTAICIYIYFSVFTLPARYTNRSVTPKTCWKINRTKKNAHTFNNNSCKGGRRKGEVRR